MALASKKNDKDVPGVVSGCERLNVRVRASSTAEIVNIINKGDIVTVDSNTLGNKFYKIKMIRHNLRPLSDEVIDGYCMSEYISLIGGRGSTKDREVVG